MFSKSELVDLYLSQQSELYGNNLHINKSQVHDCLQCNGDSNSDLVFINQGSYKKDDLDYFNKSNQLLKKILSAISLSYENVFIVNLLNVFYNSKEIKVEEMLDCKEHLEHKISLVPPKLIVSLGQKPSNYLLKNDLHINDMRNKTFKYKDIDVVITYNPCELIENPVLKKSCWNDFKNLKNKYFN